MPVLIIFTLLFRTVEKEFIPESDLTNTITIINILLMIPVNVIKHIDRKLHRKG